MTWCFFLGAMVRERPAKRGVCKFIRLGGDWLAGRRGRRLLLYADDSAAGVVVIDYKSTDDSEELFQMCGSRFPRVGKVTSRR